MNTEMNLVHITPTWIPTVVYKDYIVNCALFILQFHIWYLTDDVYIASILV